MIWIIEPHADDAFLSLHEHLTGPWAEARKTIVTVFCDKKRAAEGSEYARRVGCSHVALGYEEGGGLSKSAGVVPPFEQWGVPVAGVDRLVFPIGLQHPDHLAVRARVPIGGRVSYYLDTPYYAKLKLRDELSEAVEGATVLSMVYASTRKWKFIDVFKSQGRYFFHHPPTDLPRLEMTMRV